MSNHWEPGPGSCPIAPRQTHGYRHSCPDHPLPPNRWEMFLSRLRYHRDRTRRRWQVITFRCPACPKKIRGPHKFGCSLYGKDQTVISMVRRSRGWDDPDG